MTAPAENSLTATVRLTVPFHDVDPAGLVWHGNYFRYFEEARCAVLDRIGYNYRQMAESGVIWPLADLRSRFTAPVRYHDEITVEARLVEWEYRLVFDYVLRGPDGAVAATGRTVQVPVSMDGGELLIGAPEVLERRIEKALALRDNDGVASHD